MSYAVHWVEAHEARHEHLDIWNRNLAMKVAPERRFEWLYRDNPTGPGRLAVLEALDDSGTSQGFVGTAGFGRRLFRDGPRTLRAALMCDVAVDLGHRSAMPAFMVTTELRRHVLAAYDIAYGFPNHLSEPLVTRGYKRLTGISRYALALRHARHVREKVEAQVAHPLAREALAGAGGLALDGARVAIVAARAAAVAPTYRLDWEPAVDARFDQLWQEAASDYQIVGVRDAAFVRWRFHDRAEGRFTLVGLVRRSGGALDGYAALEQQGDVWHVRDIFARLAALPALLRLLCFDLMRRGASSISLRILAPPSVVAALTDLGFRERADKRTIVCGIGKKSELDSKQIYDIARWYVTEADEDA